jgi:hypothetical protein
MLLDVSPEDLSTDLELFSRLPSNIACGLAFGELPGFLGVPAN